MMMSMMSMDEYDEQSTEHKEKEVLRRKNASIDKCQIQSIEVDNIRAQLTQLNITLEDQVDDSHKHEKRSKHCIDEELHCGVDSVLATPDTNNKIHWD